MEIKYPDKNQLILMLEREEKIRMSEDYVNKCSDVKNEINGWLRISEELQYEIVKEFGYTSEIEQHLAVNRMRRAQYIYPSEPLFKTISVYVRNNIANEGNLKENDVVPNLQIHTTNLENVNLHETFSKSKNNLLLCGSHT
jgi:hypothetical protein